MSKVLTVASSGSFPFRVPAIAQEAGAPLDPTLFPVMFAFPVEGSDDPADNTYVAGTWELAKGLYYGRGVIKNLPEGRYDIWMWINGGPSASPREKVGTVVVT